MRQQEGEATAAQLAEGLAERLAEREALLHRVEQLQGGLAAADQRAAALRADCELRDREASAMDEMLAAARATREQLELDVDGLRRAAAEATALHQETVARWDADSAAERREHARLQEALAAAEHSLHAAQAELLARQGDAAVLAEHLAEIAGLTASLTAAQRDSEMGRETLSGVLERLTQAESETEAARQTVADHDRAAIEAQAWLETLRLDWADREAAFDRELATLRGTAADARAAAEALRSDVAQLQDAQREEGRRADSALAEVADLHAAALLHAASLEAAVEAARQLEAGAQAATVAAASAAVDEMRADLEASRAAAAARRVDFDRLTTEHGLAARERDAAQGELWALTAEHEKLRQALSRTEETAARAAQQVVVSAAAVEEMQRARDDAAEAALASGEEIGRLRDELVTAMRDAASRQETLASDTQTLGERCSALGERLSDSEARCRAADDAATQASRQAEAATAARQRAEQALREQEDTTGAALAELRQVLAGREAALAEVTERCEALSRAACETAELRVEQQREFADLAQRCDEARARVAQLDAEGAVATARRDEQGRVADELGAALVRQQAATSELEAMLAGERVDAAMLFDEAVEEAVALRAHLDAVADELEQARAGAIEAVTARQDADAAVAECERLRERLAELEPLAELPPRCAAAEAARDTLQDEVETLRLTASTATRERDELHERIARLEQGMLAATETQERVLGDAHARGERLTAVEGELMRVAAARERLAEELILAHQQLEASRATAEQLEQRVATAERQVAVAHEHQTRLQEQALDVQQQLLDDEGSLASMAVDRDAALRERDALRVALAAEREQLGAEHAAAAQAHCEQTGSLAERLSAAEHERGELRAQVGSLCALRDALQEERELLRRKLAGAEDAERQKSDMARLQTRLEELERQQGDATQRHSQAVSLYMTELNQRSDALHQREIEIERLQEQLRLIGEAVEDGAEELTGVRRERDLLELQVRDLETARPRPRAGEGLRLTGDPVAVAPPVEAAQVDLPPAAPSRPEVPRPMRSEASGDLRLVEKASARRPPAAATSREEVVVHVEDDAPLRAAVRAAVEGAGGHRYMALAQGDEPPADVMPFLAVNLLARDLDPLAAILDPRWGHLDPRAFTYLAAGTRGLIAGMVDFIPYPCEPDACATRLLERPGGTQRLLMVSDKIEVMNEIRAVLNRVRCSTSLALDGRQAFDLVGMVKPDAVLIDLTLPRGEGLRLVNRLRSDPKTAGLSIIFALGEPLDLGRFRADATRVLGECRFSADDLTGSLARALTELELQEEDVRAAG